jgi:hypothetical protein
MSRSVHEITVYYRERNIKSEGSILNRSENLKTVVCDLTNEGQVESFLKGVDAVFWCIVSKT